MASGKCPACGKPVEHLDMHHLYARLDGRDAASTVTLSCGSCGTVLGAGFDPHVIKELVIREFNAS